MPIPTPRGGETEDQFIARCMGNDTMQADYPDEDQRLAVCYNSWREERADMERRSFADYEVREDEAGKVVLVGHAAVFDTLSEPLGGFRERILPGAFADSLKKPNVVALVDHDPQKLLASTKTGRVRLAEDERGLATEIEPVDTSYTRDVLNLLRAGEKQSMSFGFRTIKDTWERVDGEDVRTLHKVDLFDVSVVTSPAYTATDVGVATRSHDAWAANQRPDMADVEARLIRYRRARCG